MAVDLSTDYKTVDLAETIWLTNRLEHRDWEIKIHSAFKNALTTRELQASMGAAVRIEAAYDVPMKLVRNYSWKPGDFITDADENILMIYQADKDETTAFWRFLVYDPKIAFDLRHVIDVYDLQFTKDAAGATTADGEHLLYTEVAARVQWQNGQPGAYAKRTGEVERATIYLGERLRLTHGSLIRWYDRDYQKLRQFDIISWQMPDRLDQLMEVSVEVRP